jgi:predicted nucleic acid-binding protein
VKVLVDTSVWVRFLRGEQPFLAGLEKLLLREEVLGHELVHGELFIGDRGGRRALLADYVQLEQAATVLHDEVIVLVKAKRLHGVGLGWIDVHVLASALAAGVSLWTADRALGETARRLGVAYRFVE